MEVLTLQRSRGKLFTKSIKATKLHASPDMTSVSYFYISQVISILKTIQMNVHFPWVLKHFIAAILYIWQEIVLACQGTAFGRYLGITAKWALKMFILMLNQSI